MTQLENLSKNVIGVGAQGVNVMGVGFANPEEVMFESLYNKDFNFLDNQGSVYR